MPKTLPIIMLITAGVLLLIVVLRLLFAAVRASVVKDVCTRVDTSQAIKAAGFANFYGVLSKGMTQIRGNGSLVLLPDKLFFLQAVPRREVNIPLEKISELSTPSKFLGKLSLRPLLRVDFTTESGPDAAAFLVSGPTDWIAAIKTAQNKAS